MSLEVGKRLRGARIVSGLSARQVAALAGVSPSTVTRIESGQIMPRYDVVMRLLKATGLDETWTPASRPSAIWTARWLRDPRLAQPSDTEEWLERWEALGLLKKGRIIDERSLLFRAARSASLGDRPGTIEVARPASLADVGRALDAQGVDWALSGSTAANRYATHATDAWPVIYVADTSRAIDAAGLSLRRPGAITQRLTLLPFDGFSEIGRWDDTTQGWTGARWADLWQVIMDCYAGTQRMPEQADHLVDLVASGGLRPNLAIRA